MSKPFLPRNLSLRLLAVTLGAQVGFPLDSVAQTNKADYMPPIAPQLDIGTGAPKAAPQAVKSLWDGESGQPLHVHTNHEAPSSGLPPVAPAFRSPFVTADGGRPVLHAAATTNDSLHNPIFPQSRPYFGAASQMPLAGAATVPSSQGFAARTSAGPTLGRTVMRSATRAGVSSAIGLIPGPLGRSLHCPLCRLMGGI